MGLHHPGILSGYYGGVGSERRRVEADVNIFQEVIQGVFIDGNICLLKRHREKGGLLGRRTFCDKGAVTSLAYNW